MATTTRRRTRVCSAAALATSLTLSSIGVAHADTVVTTDPAEAAAGYLVSALADGERIQSAFDGDLFDAPGPTADTVYALAAVGVAVGSITAATDWLETQAGTYTGAGDDIWAGATGKLLLVAATTGRDPRDFGGVDLVTKVAGVEVTDPDPDDEDDLPGRFRDVSGFGDFSTPLTQSLVLLGLHRTDSTTPSPEAVQVLLDQQCDDGGFSGAFLVGDDASCSASVDTTGYAVQALDALGKTDAVTDAVAWLASVQSAEGSFASAAGRNANSTGLAAVALALGGGDADAITRARDFVIGLQDGPGTDTPGAIPFNADERGFVELSTAQAVPGLVGVSLAEVSAAGASGDVPTFAPVDGADGGEPTDPEPPTDIPAGEDDPEQGTGAGAGAADSEQEIEQPIRVDAGVSPSGAPVGSLLLAFSMLGGIALLGLVATRRRRHEQV